MLTVDDYELIRRKHLIDGMSQRAIAQELTTPRRWNTNSSCQISCSPSRSTGRSAGFSSMFASTTPRMNRT